MKVRNTTIESIKNLPYFNGNEVEVNCSGDAIMIILNESTHILVLLTPDGFVRGNSTAPLFTIYSGTDGTLIMDRIQNNLKIGIPEPFSTKDYVLNTYNKDVHEQSNSLVPYDVITVMHTINEMIEFELQNKA